MKSLRQLRDDLLGIRLSAANVSLWTVQATLIERANRAINDAVATYEMHVTSVYSSLALAVHPAVVALPRDVGRIIRIEARGDTLQGLTRRDIQGWRQAVTVQTNLLYFGETVVWPYYGITEFVDVVYESQQTELPPDCVLIGTALATNVGVGAGFVAGGFVVSGGSPAARWKAPGYLELSAVGTSTSDVRELVRYDVTLPGGFTGLTRAVEGQLWHWAEGSVVSAIYEALDITVPVIMAKAQASMYEFFIRNRVLYDQYTSIASEQALGVGDLLGLSRAMEDKADRAYDRIRQLPAPSRVVTKPPRK